MERGHTGLMERLESSMRTAEDGRPQDMADRAIGNSTAPSITNRDVAIPVPKPSHGLPYSIRPLRLFALLHRWKIKFMFQESTVHITTKATYLSDSFPSRFVMTMKFINGKPLPASAPSAPNPFRYPFSTNCQMRRYLPRSFVIPHPPSPIPHPPSHQHQLRSLPPSFPLTHSLRRATAVTASFPSLTVPLIAKSTQLLRHCFLPRPVRSAPYAPDYSSLTAGSCPRSLPQRSSKHNA